MLPCGSPIGTFIVNFMKRSWAIFPDIFFSYIFLVFCDVFSAYICACIGLNLVRLA